MQVFARGANFHRQIWDAPTGNIIQSYKKLPFPDNIQIKQLEAHFTQSVCLLTDGQVLQWGWTLDQLTSTRTLAYYKKAPNFFIQFQKYFPIKTLGMRTYISQPSLVNPKMMEKTKVQSLSFGASYIHALDRELYGMGDNYKGQLGLQDVNYKHDFKPILFDSPIEQVGKFFMVACGFQHSIILTKYGSCFGTGKVNYSQYAIDPKLRPKKISSDFYYSFQPLSLPKKIAQVACGFHHSLFLSADQSLYSIGLNNHTQCGHSNFQTSLVSSYKEIYLDLEQGEKIEQIACGRSHSLFYTNHNRQFYNVSLFFFGASFYNQQGISNPVFNDQCSPIPLNFEFLKTEKIVRIKSNFDRICIFTESGKAYIWGGESSIDSIGGHHSLEELSQSLGGGKIVDVGMGYLHTLVAVQ